MSARGGYRLEPLETLLEEAQALRDLGVRELVLIAQDTTDYGHDLGMHDGLATLLEQLTIASFETEDYLIWAGITDGGQPLSEEQCQRLFSLPATPQSMPYSDVAVDSALNRMLEAGRQTVLQTNAGRNAGFFDAEMGKLEHWAEDMKTSLEIKLKQLDIDIKMRKTEARKITLLDEKVKAHRAIKDLEKTRNDLRLNLYQAQDDVEQKKETLIQDIEARLKQSLKVETVFTVRWSVT